MTELISWHNQDELKAKIVGRLKHHAELDEIIQGIGWESGKGCAVGCTLDGYNHAAYETELGLPEWLARLEDALFEGMTNADAKNFPIEFAEAIPKGLTSTDFEIIKAKFLIFILRENIEYVKSLQISNDLRAEVLHAIELCLELHIQYLETGTSATQLARSAAESAARSAAWSSTRSLTEPAAAWSATGVALSATGAARSAAESAAAATAEGGIWSATVAAAMAAAAGAAAESIRAADVFGESVAWSAIWAADATALAAQIADGVAARSSAFKTYADKLIALLRESSSYGPEWLRRTND